MNLILRFYIYLYYSLYHSIKFTCNSIYIDSLILSSFFSFYLPLNKGGIFLVLEIFGSLLISSGLVGMLMQPRKRDEGKIILDILNANNIFRKRQYSVMGKKGEEIIKAKINKIDRLESFVRYYITLPRGISHLEVKKLTTELSEGLNKELTVSHDYF